tara:strand:+ start:1860 stop:2897 length:1038 start_codon:yes stop_codon:yes gene_type:complete
MTKKSVHQKLNLDAVKHFGIDCDPYGVIVDTVGENIETVQIDKSALNLDKLLKILEVNNKKSLNMTLYKKAFLFPNAPVSQERIKASLKEHKITLTNNYEDADLYITHNNLFKEHSDGENINTRSLFCKLWNYDSVSDGSVPVDLYSAKLPNRSLGKVIYDKKCENNTDRYVVRDSLPYESYLLTSLGINLAYEVEVNNIDVYSIEQVMSESANKIDLTEQLIEDICSQIISGEEGILMASAIIPTIKYNENQHLLWEFSKKINKYLHNFRRNKDVQYWMKCSSLEKLSWYSALDMIKHLEKRNELTKESFRYLEPSVRKKIEISNRDLYTFKVEVKPEYKKLMI